MSIPKYGVLKGPVVDCVAEADPGSPHYQVQIRAQNVDYRIAVNVKSTDATASELLYHIDENFNHPVTSRLPALPMGYTPVPSQPGGIALDYIRENLVDKADMHAIPPNLPGPDNDLNEKLDFYVGRAKKNPNITVYAFGSRWGPEAGIKDKVFKFLPGNGIHDIHMNQGNPAAGGHAGDNGIYQDGGLLLHMGHENRWVAIFLAFQSQEWHTDEAKGDPGLGKADNLARIIAALVNPKGADAGMETVTILNRSAKAIDLKGWKLLDRLNHEQTLGGMVQPGDALRVKLGAAVQLGNDGGTITLLDAKGLKVHGVAYTKQDANEESVTVVF
jgi:uncharacterized protein YukJ